MDQESHPLDTREFVALWNAAKGEHVAQRLGAALECLAARGTLPPMSERQVALLAQAVQLAGDPAAGPAVALQFLETQAGIERTPGG